MPGVSLIAFYAPQHFSWTAERLSLNYEFPDVKAFHVEVETETVSIGGRDFGTNKSSFLTV